MRSSRLCFFLLLAAISVSPLFAQYQGTTAARAVFDQATKEYESGSFTAAAADFKKATILDPKFAEAYKQYFFASVIAGQAPYMALQAAGKTESDEAWKKLDAEAQKWLDDYNHTYETLAKEDPKNPVYPWILAQEYVESDPLKQERLCQQSIDIDPKFGPGYGCLSDVAFVRADRKQAIPLLRKAVELDPDNSMLAIEYANNLDDDPAAFKAAVMDVLRKFPNSQDAAKALYLYADGQKTDAAKVEAFEQLVKQFPPAQFQGGDLGAVALFKLYDRLDPPKAGALAHELMNADPKGVSNRHSMEWAKYVLYSDTMAGAERDINENKPDLALAALQKVKAPTPYFFDMRREQLLQARALDGKGDTAGAYAALLSIYVGHPTEEIRAALDSYGTKLGKTAHQTDVEIASGIKAKSTPAIPFTLPDLKDGKEVSLEEYKGHVVILDFWYPNCGPCRGEFPYLNRVAEKYKNKGLVVLAINGRDDQKAFALPVLNNLGYDFIPLEATAKWASDVYHVAGYPATFLVGADGRVYFQPSINSELEERSAELEVEELLSATTDHASAGKLTQ